MAQRTLIKLHAMGISFTTSLRQPVACPARWTQHARQHKRQVAVQAALSLSDPPQTDRMNVYTAYTVYKGKSAMSLKVIRPRWERVASGITTVGEGKLLLEFAHARGEREYDWQSKESFSLSATECAELLEALERREKRSLFHDPNKMKEGEGTISKSFNLQPNDTGYFFGLSVSNKLNNQNHQFSTPLSKAEARTVHRILDFAIPRLLGMDEVFAGPPDVVASQGYVASVQPAPQF